LNRKSVLGAIATPFLLGVICLFALEGCGNSSNTTRTATVVNNTTTITANSGPIGASGGGVNGLYVTVTVCQHGTTTCATINNVQVDTGSIGLRILPSALGAVTLTPILVNGSPLEECIQYGDTSYSWGPLQAADVQIAGERALGIPVQLLGDTAAAAPASCLTTPVNPNLPNGGNDDTVASLNANGILGIGNAIFDCGTFCATSANNFYYTCPSGTCGEVAVGTIDQEVNPVAEFVSSDNNGVMINLPAVGTTGAVTVSGTMTFGIGTQSDNALGTAMIFAADECGDIPTVTFNGISYTDTSCNSGGSGFGGFVDTGSNGLFVSDATTLSSLGIFDCPSSSPGFPFYCVNGGGTATLSSVGLSGFGGVGSENISLTIRDATALFSTNNSVFSNLGGDSNPGSSSPSTDSFDLGLPFFFGRTVFVGIAGANAPNGYFAF
jgi:Protein of unknown function (DUF3443)